MIKINLPSEVKEIIDKLYKNGYEAYTVGGCVRDSLLLLRPQDWDICTSALPEQIMQCFKEYKTLKTGIKHGTITVIINGENFEITTYRIDGKYSNGRHPDKVIFIASLKEDLMRRDFTINAMAYNHKEGLIDYFGGINDLNNKIIRCVGNCNQRFREDSLRILRALRFAACYNFEIYEKTHKAINENKELLTSLSAERIREELNKLLLGKGAEKILLTYPSVLTVFIPYIKATIGYEQNNPYHIFDIWTHIVKSIVSAKYDLILRIAMLFHDLGKPLCEHDKISRKGFCNHAEISAIIAKETLKKLRYDIKTIELVYDLIYYHDTKLYCDRISLKYWLNKLGLRKFELLLEVKKADAKAQNPIYLKKRLKIFDDIQLCIDDIIKNKMCYNIKDLAVKGNDIILLGVKQGEQIGQILNHLLGLVIEEKIPNDKKQLIDEAKKLISKS